MSEVPCKGSEMIDAPIDEEASAHAGLTCVTDVLLSRLFLEQFPLLRFNGDSGRWLYYEAGIYRPDRGSRVPTLLRRWLAIRTCCARRPAWSTSGRARSALTIPAAS